jgi:L-lactate dehydrogenase complex protein LldG
MNARDAILRAVRTSGVEDTALPALEGLRGAEGDPVTRFVAAARAVGAEVVVHDGSDAAGPEEMEVAQGGRGRRAESMADVVAGLVAELHPTADAIASAVPDLEVGNVDLDAVADPHDLASLDLLICEGDFAVAENGAVWLPESRLVHRAAMFLAQHVLIALDRRPIVWDMHEAYARLDLDADGFGLFVAGPSKTADIEQALVIGAHGPRSLTIVLRAEP